MEVFVLVEPNMTHQEPEAGPASDHPSLQSTQRPVFLLLITCQFYFGDDSFLIIQFWGMSVRS